MWPIIGKTTFSATSVNLKTSTPVRSMRSQTALDTLMEYCQRLQRALPSNRRCGYACLNHEWPGCRRRHLRLPSSEKPKHCCTTTSATCAIAQSWDVRACLWCRYRTKPLAPPVVPKAPPVRGQPRNDRDESAFSCGDFCTLVTRLTERGAG